MEELPPCCRRYRRVYWRNLGTSPSPKELTYILYSCASSSLRQVSHAYKDGSSSEPLGSTPRPPLWHASSASEPRSTHRRPSIDPVVASTQRLRQIRGGHIVYVHFDLSTPTPITDVSSRQTSDPESNIHIPSWPNPASVRDPHHRNPFDIRHLLRNHCSATSGRRNEVDP